MYNNVDIKDQIEIISSNVRQDNLVLFKDQITLKINKNFKTESDIKIIYKGIKKDKICNNHQDCRFNKLLKDYKVKKFTQNWYYTNQKNEVIKESPEILFERNENLLNINLKENQIYNFKISNLEINNLTQDSASIDLNKEIKSIKIYISDNLGNQYAKDISYETNQEKSIYEKFQNYKEEINNFTLRQKENTETKITNEIKDQEDQQNNREEIEDLIITESYKEELDQKITEKNCPNEY